MLSCHHNMFDVPRYLFFVLLLQQHKKTPSHCSRDETSVFSSPSIIIKNIISLFFLLVDVVLGKGGVRYSYFFFFFFTTLLLRTTSASKFECCVYVRACVIFDVDDVSAQQQAIKRVEFTPQCELIRTSRPRNKGKCDPRNDIILER